MAFCIACIIQGQNIANRSRLGSSLCIKICFLFIRVRSVLLVVGQGKICNQYIQFVWEIVKLHWHIFCDFVGLCNVMV